jgi:hypothetical protein
VTGPGQKDTHSKWDRQDNTQQSDTSVSIDESFAKVLEIKRWDVREEPFQGFNSPPGRF